METRHLNASQTNEAAEILKNGGVVAIPTETVYGLAASAFDEEAIKKIYKAKGRPTDNPLIVHIADINSLDAVVAGLSLKAAILAKKFWPGPLTMVLPKSRFIPEIVSAGLDSVAVRFPSNETAQEIIIKAGVPLVAPSANKSGKTSPTTVQHVLLDMDGLIDAVVDGGSCTIGLESTVVSLMDGSPRLLRPGAITLEDLQNVIDEVKVDESIYRDLNSGEKAISPGMKYKHYAPSAKVIVVSGNQENYINFVNSASEKNVMALCFDEDIPYIKIPYISYGGMRNADEQARNLFDALRKTDEMSAKVVYARCPDKDGVGMAVYNRLMRAAGFEILNV